MNLWFDIQYALRNLIKSGSFSALTIAVMTIGLGATIYTASVVKSLLFDPVYFPEGERVSVLIAESIMSGVQPCYMITRKFGMRRRAWN